MSIPLLILHLAQAALSVVILAIASSTIPKLLKYEDKSKKAAEYSQKAADELSRTRTTQGSAVVAGLLSLLTAISSFFTTSSTLTSASTNLLNIGVCIFAYLHVTDFWNAKAKIPMMTDFNDAITQTNQMAALLPWLAGISGVALLWTVVVGS